MFIIHGNNYRYLIYGSMSEETKIPSHLKIDDKYKETIINLFKEYALIITIRHIALAGLGFLVFTKPVRFLYEMTITKLF